jgi:hypothetical protein
MFEIFCPTHKSRVLLSDSRIVGFRNTLSGPVLEWRCWCDTRGSLHGTAARRGAHTHVAA